MHRPQPLTTLSVGQVTSEVSLFEHLNKLVSNLLPEVALNYDLVIYSRPTVVVPFTHFFCLNVLRVVYFSILVLL